MIYGNSYVKCQKCGEIAKMYDADLPTRRIKLPYRLILIFWVIIPTICVFLYMILFGSFLDSAFGTSNISFAMTFAVIIVSLPILIYLICLGISASRHRRAKVVFCPYCRARYTQSQLPEYLQGWDLQKFEDEELSDPHETARDNAIRNAYYQAVTTGWQETR